MNNNKYIINVTTAPEPENPRQECYCLGTMVTNHRNYELGGSPQDEMSSDAPLDTAEYCDEASNFLCWVLQCILLEQPKDAVPSELYEYEVDYDCGSSCNVLWKDIPGYDSKDEFGGGTNGGKFFPDELPTEFVHAMNEWMKNNLCIHPLSIYDHSGVSMSIGARTGWDHSNVGYIYITRIQYEKAYGEGTFTQEAALEVLTQEVDIYSAWMEGAVYDVEVYSVVEDYNYVGEVIQKGPFLATKTHECGLREDQRLSPVESSGWFYGYQEAEAYAKTEALHICSSHLLGGDAGLYLVTFEGNPINNGVITVPRTETMIAPKVMALVAHSKYNVISCEPLKQPTYPRTGEYSCL